MAQAQNNNNDIEKMPFERAIEELEIDRQAA